MKMVELQDFLFSQKPNRRQLLAYESELEKSHAIQVFRNHSFELVEHTIDAFLDYAGLGIRFSYSGYDDSFSFSELDKKADAIIIWVDAKRYNAVDTFSEFLEGRLRYLRSIYDRPILLIPSGAEYKSHPGVLVLSLSELEKKLGDKFVDERAAKITGTSLSNLAMVEISRELGLRYLPALLRPSLKAVVVDFDNTLYGGVLGEDGIDGLEITDGHKKLQEYLKALSEKGIFLCASSKNELEDVEKLLESRTDFILRKDDFTKLSVSWQPKSRSMEEISRYLNIGIDSMVMVDDNIGELAEMTMAHPELNIIHAKEDALKTCEVLKSYPRLSIIHAGKEAAMRKGDVIANEKRRNLAQSSSSKEDYIRSLKIVLGYDMDNES